MLEAMANGLPVVCLDLGGPGVMVDEACGRVIQTRGRSAADVSQALGDALLELATDHSIRARLSVGAVRRAREFDSDRMVEQVYDGNVLERLAALSEAQP